MLGPYGSVECAALKDFSETIGNAWHNALKTLHRRGYSAAGLDPEALADPGVLPLIQATAGALDSAISRAPLSETMRQRLSESNFIFSGFKTFHSLNEAFPSMVDANGDLKLFERFLNDVQKIEKRYNVNYLRAEYNFAVASAESAARWERIAADGDRYDLQYRTAGDGRVRPEHAALDKVTLPVSSPFWDSFMPPNGWNCRCSVVQVRKGKYPTTDIAEAIERGEKATVKDKRGMMRFNPGKLGKTFPDYNPYTIRHCRDCDIARGSASMARTTPPDNSLCQACQYIRKCEKLRSEIIPYGKGTIEISNLVNRKDNDFERLMQVARFFAERGSEVKLTPKMSRPAQFDYDCVYGDLKNTPYYGKCPDLRIDGRWYEHEGFVTDNPKRAFNNMVNHGLKQSNRIIIDRPNLTDRFMQRSITHRINLGLSVDEVWLRNPDGTIDLLFKKTDG